MTTTAAAIRGFVGRKNTSQHSACTEVPSSTAFQRVRPSRADRKPARIPQIDIVTVDAEIAQPAAALSMPIPSVMIGRPHSSVNTTSSDSPIQ